jgi:ubiquinone/menaquinone biosynthesis C-methylase UbiE
VARPKAHPLFSRLHPVITSMREKRGDADNRAELVSGLSGRVIEIGSGIGANFRYYPGTVEKLVAVEPQPWLRQRAEEAAAEATISIEVVDGDAEALALPDGSFDAAVASLMLCSVDDQDAVIAELFRVVKPGGQLRFFEHVVSERPTFRRLQKVADATVYPHLIGGCHIGRDTKANIESAGFQVTACRRFPMRLNLLTPTEPHLLGTALRP